MTARMLPKTHSHLVLCLYVAVGLIVSGAAQRAAGISVSVLVLVVWAVVGRFFWDTDARR